MSEFENEEVKKAFSNYPQEMREKFLLLRKLVIETASETDGVASLEETLKWVNQAILPKVAVQLEWTGKIQNQINTLCTLIVKLS